MVTVPLKKIGVSWCCCCCCCCCNDDANDDANDGGNDDANDDVDVVSSACFLGLILKPVEEEEDDDDAAVSIRLLGRPTPLPARDQPRNAVTPGGLVVHRLTIR